MSSKPPLKSFQELKSFTKFVLPGGLPVYDTMDGSFLFFLEEPIVLADLIAREPKARRGGIRIDQLAAFGIQFRDEKIVFQYPTKQISLDSYTGSLKPFQFVFEKPSELDTVIDAMMSQYVLLILVEQELEAGKTKTIRARYITDNKDTEISILGLCIADPKQFQNANVEPSVYPPASLRLDLPPHHIPSQHLGECASDTMQTELFFADGFADLFAIQADALYKQFITKNPRILFDLERPELLAATIESLHLTKPSEHLESVQHILTNMVRRYIFVRLLDLSTTKQIESLKIQQTQCLIPKGVNRVSRFRNRRPSINLYAGLSIHERMIKIVGRQFELGTTMTLKPEGYNIFDYYKIICTLLSAVSSPLPYTLVLSLQSDILPLPPHTVVAVSLFVESKKDGHAISIFRNDTHWYLQDNNLGVVKSIDEEFHIESYLQSASRFFLCNFDGLKMKQAKHLVENQWFTEDDIQKNIHKESTYYGYFYRTIEGKLEQKILYVERGQKANDSFFEGPHRFYYCFGTVPPASTKNALKVCSQQSVAEVENAPVKSIPLSKRLTLSEELLQQLQASYKDSKTKPVKKPLVVSSETVSKLSEQFTGFEKKPVVKAPPQRLTTKNLTALQHQFSGFSNTTDKGK